MLHRILVLQTSWKKLRMEYITFDLGEMGEHLRLEKSLHSSENLIVTNNF